MLRARGVYPIDTDEIAHAVLAKGTDVSKAVADAFGRGILNANETINRARLGEIIFADESKRLLLNQLMHPAIRREWLAQVEALAKKNFSGVVAVAVPLLYE